MNEEFPKALHHPQFRKGAMKEIKGIDSVSGKPFTDYQGEPDMFPPVTVNNEQQEAFHRAKGYLMHGEVPPAPVDYAEYPLMLSHPDHVDAVPDDFDIKKSPSGEVISTRIPGHPEKFPAIMVKSPEDEQKWLEKGYARIGKTDALASERSKASPYDPNFSPEEYPKVVNGKIVDPFAEMDHNRYPMYVGDLLVKNAQEEAQARGEAVSEPLAPCVICGEDIEEDDPVSEGPMGKYHLVHMAPKTANDTSVHMVNETAIEVPGKPRRGRRPKPKE